MSDEAVETQSEQPPLETPKRIRRGMKYIGDGVEHYPAVPPRDLTWEESRGFFGTEYEQRRKIVEREGAIYAWDPPKEGDDGEDE